MPTSTRPTFRRMQMNAGALPWLIALAAVIGCIALAVWSTSLRGDLATADDRIVALGRERDQLRQSATASAHPLTPTAEGPQDASGTLFLASDGGGVLSVVNMPSPPEGMIYQLWMLPDNEGTPVPVGTFTVSDAGVGFLLVPADHGVVRGFGISWEPGGGSPTPTGTMLLAGSVSDARG